MARADRAFDLELVAVIGVKPLQRLDDHIVERQPDRPAPVRIAGRRTRIRRVGVRGISTSNGCRNPTGTRSRRACGATGTSSGGRATATADAVLPRSCRASATPAAPVRGGA